MELVKKKISDVCHAEFSSASILKRVQDDWKHLVIPFFILLLGAFLRLYKISGYMTFLGDEGRDALVWLRMIRQGKLTLIGPQTSIGNMYLGPLYYYLMLPFYLLFGLSPVGPSIGVALFGVATIFLIWWIGRGWFGEVAGLIAAFLYALSPVAIVYSHSSWNPNIMPFFALLTVWGVWQFWQKKNFVWLPVVGVTLSFCLQSHYLGLLLIPVIGLFWGIRGFVPRSAPRSWVPLCGRIPLCGREFRGKDKGDRGFWRYSAAGLLLFLVLTVAPLVWFDLRHNFINYKAFHKFFTVRQTTVNLKVYKAIPNLWPLWQMMVTRLLAAREIIWGKWLAVLLIAGLVGQKKAWLKKLALQLIGVWILVGLVGMGVYKQHIYDHYFGFIFPAVFLLAGFLLQRLGQSRKLGRLGMLWVLGIATWFNVKNLPLKYPPNYQMKKVQEVDRKIVKESGGQPFNFGLIAKQNYEAGYEYFLEAWRAPLVHIDPQRADQTITNQLFVVCEDEKCEPVGHEKAQIANFGWTKIGGEWEFPWGVRLFRLVHLNKTKNQK